MAIFVGKDYVFSPHLRTVLKGAGPTRACALITRRALYILPYVSISGSGMTIVKTTVTLGGVSPAQYVASLLADPKMTPEALDDDLAKQCSGIEGAVARPLAAFKRIKVRTGFLSRGVRLTERAAGVWGGLTENFGWRVAKDDMQSYLDFFDGDPRLV